VICVHINIQFIPLLISILTGQRSFCNSYCIDQYIPTFSSHFLQKVIGWPEQVKSNPDMHWAIFRSCDLASWQILIKPTKCANVSNLFLNETLHVSDSSSVHHQKFFTVHTTVEQDQDVPSWSCSTTVSKPVWHIPLLCVQWKPPDDGQRNCPKHVEFHSKNKFEKLVHLVGFIKKMHWAVKYDIKTDKCT
jgi:hypothetical protein